MRPKVVFHKSFRGGALIRAAVALKIGFDAEVI